MAKWAILTKKTYSDYTRLFKLITSVIQPEDILYIDINPLKYEEWAEKICAQSNIKVIYTARPTWCADKVLIIYDGDYEISTVQHKELELV